MTELVGIAFFTRPRLRIHAPNRCHSAARMQPTPCGPASRASVAGVARARKAALLPVTLRRIASERCGWLRAPAVPRRKARTNRCAVSAYPGSELRRDELAT